MARIRSIHPGIWTDEKFVALSESAKLLYIGLLHESDDNGVFEWKPLTLKMRIFPASSVDVASLLEDLLGSGKVRMFRVDERAYGVIRDFVLTQRPRNPKAVHPAPPEALSFSGRAAQ